MLGRDWVHTLSEPMPQKQGAAEPKKQYLLKIIMLVKLAV